eukprot:tig00001657_g9544.t1
MVAFGGPPLLPVVQELHASSLGMVQGRASPFTGTADRDRSESKIAVRSARGRSLASSRSTFHGSGSRFLVQAAAFREASPDVRVVAKLRSRSQAEDEEDEEGVGEFLDEDLPDLLGEDEGEEQLLSFFERAAEDEGTPSPRPLSSGPQPAFFADYVLDAPKPAKWWTTAIKRSGQRGALEAMATFRRMLESGCEADRITYCTVLDVLSDFGDVERMEGVVAEMVAAGFEADADVRLLLLRAHGRAGDLPAVQCLFEEAKQAAAARHAAGEFKADAQAPGSLPRVYELYAVACTRCQRPDLSLAAPAELRAAGFEPTLNTYSCVARYYGTTGQPEAAWEVLEKAAADGVAPKIHDITAVLCRFIRYEQSEAALERFAQILGPVVERPGAGTAGEGEAAGALEAVAQEAFGEALPLSAVRVGPAEANALAINLIRGVADIYGRDVEAARTVARILGERGVQPEEKTLTCLTTVLVECGAGQAAAEVVEEMQRRALDSETAYNIIALKLIKDYVRRRQLGGANRVIAEMIRSGRKPSAKTWTELVAGCLLNRKPDMAGKVVREMREAGLKPEYPRIRALVLSGELEGLKEFSGLLRTDRVKRRLTAARIAAGGRRKAIYGENPNGRPGGELQMGQAGGGRGRFQEGPGRTRFDREEEEGFGGRGGRGRYEESPERFQEGPGRSRFDRPDDEEGGFPAGPGRSRFGDDGAGRMRFDDDDGGFPARGARGGRGMRGGRGGRGRGRGGRGGYGRFDSDRGGYGRFGSERGGYGGGYGSERGGYGEGEVGYGLRSVLGMGERDGPAPDKGGYEGYEGGSGAPPAGPPGEKQAPAPPPAGAGDLPFLF